MTSNKLPEALFQEREKRINDAIALKEPDRVPVMCIFGFFPARIGGITFEDAMYDYDKTMKTWIRTMLEFEPDTCDDPFTSRFFGKLLEQLDYKQFRWPGHGVGPNLSFQYVEDEYMKANEYNAFLSDPSDFMFRKYWPRIFQGFLQDSWFWGLPDTVQEANFCQQCSF